MDRTSLRRVLAAFALAVLALSLMAAKPATSPNKVPDGVSLLATDLEVEVSDGIVAEPFTGSVTFTSKETGPVIIVDVDLPSGVTVTDVTIDGASTCDVVDAMVAFAGGRISVSGIACDYDETLGLAIDGESLITTADTYDVSTQYKTVSPRNRKGATITMWKVFGTPGFAVVEPAPIG